MDNIISNDKNSFDIWLNEKLVNENNDVFTGNLQLYSNDPSLFSRRFLCPAQLSVLKRSTSFCLDATHSISSRSMDILYTLLTHLPETGTGYPFAYMVTNNHTVGPVNQWLLHLRQQCGLSPVCITIDCCVAEVNTIKAALPETLIHYCEFHVLRAWKKSLDSKVKLDASFTSEELGTYKNQLLNLLKEFLTEENRESFDLKLQSVKEAIRPHPDFSRYFENRWIGSKDIISRWARLFVEDSHVQYLTNNYIESWHNQLKTLYFKRARISKLDCLVFILTKDVAFYIEEELDHIRLNNGRMVPTERELAKHKHSATQIDDIRLPSLISNPLGGHKSSLVDDQNDGGWLVNSFNETIQLSCLRRL